MKENTMTKIELKETMFLFSKWSNHLIGALEIYIDDDKYSDRDTIKIDEDDPEVFDGIHETYLLIKKMMKLIDIDLTRFG